MLYVACCMPQRTQIYLSDEQRARLDAAANRDGVTMAEMVRRAIDAYLLREDDLAATFGTAPGLSKTVPGRDEWDRG